MRSRERREKLLQLLLRPLRLPLLASFESQGIGPTLPITPNESAQSICPTDFSVLFSDFRLRLFSSAGLSISAPSCCLVFLQRRRRQRGDQSSRESARVSARGREGQLTAQGSEPRGRGPRGAHIHPSFSSDGRSRVVESCRRRRRSSFLVASSVSAAFLRPSLFSPERERERERERNKRGREGRKACTIFLGNNTCPPSVPSCRRRRRPMSAFSATAENCEWMGNGRGQYFTWAPRDRRERRKKRSNGPETTRTDWVTTTEREREELGDGDIARLVNNPTRSSQNHNTLLPEMA